MGSFILLFVGSLNGCISLPIKPPRIPFSEKPQAIQPIKKAPPSVKVIIVEPSDADRINALTLVKSANKAYAAGDYVEAESLLKNAISLYPFVPMANLLLGKIFLIKGSASRDYTLINNARLMFEMARALDPKMAETSTLMELFGARPIE